MRKIVLSATILLSFSSSFSQSKEITNKVKFGFNLGLNYSKIQTKNTVPLTQSTDPVGFRLGIIMDRKLTNHLSFSPKAELSFNNTKIITNKSSDSITIYQVYPVIMEFASHFTYKVHTNKATPYILFGPTYKVPLTGDKNIKYATMRSDIALDFGLGLDKQLKYFNLAPEIRYSLGLINLAAGKPFNHLYFHALTLVLNFKG